LAPMISALSERVVRVSTVVAARSRRCLRRKECAI